jgi:hypothetical protein
MIEVADEGRRLIRVYANHPGADIGKKAPANRSGQPAANLRHLKPGQYRHFKAIPNARRLHRFRRTRSRPQCRARSKDGGVPAEMPR